MIYLMTILALFQQDDFVTYDKAFEEFGKSKRPVIIVVTTKSCRFCGPMKEQIRLVKKDYPNMILCEVPLAQAKLQFDFLDFNRGVPQTFIYVYDNEREVVARLPTIIGLKPKSEIYKAWGMPN